MSSKTNLTNLNDYSFHQLVELLKAKTDHDTNVMLNNDESVSETIRFSTSADIAFPTQDVGEIKYDPNGFFRIKVKFLGLQGSQSPMPGYYLDDLSWDECQGFNEVADFLNIFNHRLIQQFHEIWMKYRYYMKFKTGGVDEFSQRIFALVGLDSQISQIKIPIEQTKLLAYAGLLANPGRSPSVLSSLVSHAFNFELDNVAVNNWLERYVEIPDGQKNCLQLQHHNQVESTELKRMKSLTRLGINFILGSKIKDRGSKFLLSIKNLPLDRFLRFLPNGSEYKTLIVFVSFILREPLCWDIELGLAKSQAQCLKLRDPVHSQLGWTTYLGQPVAEPTVILPMQN